MKSLAILVTLSVFLSASYAANITVKEQLIYTIMAADCISGKVATSLEKTTIKAKFSAEIESIKLVQYKGKELVKYSLFTATADIEASTAFDRSKPVIIIIPGYGGTFKITDGPINIAKELGLLNTANVLLLDWTPVLIKTDYFTATVYTEVLGEFLGITLAQLSSVTAIENYHLIGHGIGAHAAGFTARYFNDVYGKPINRISGLDPASFCFDRKGDNKLASTDATFVDIIHTNTAGLGFKAALGHIDFYPNGGESMPGCSKTGCSRRMATTYYANSVKSKDFLAVPCADWKTYKAKNCTANPRVVMGYFTPIESRGVYYLGTSKSGKPLGEKGLLKP